MSEKQEKTLCGMVERIVFRNAENGWTVLDLSTEKELEKVVGVLPDVCVGEQLKLVGDWVEHPSFGHQFRAQSCEHTLPSGAEAILRYLGSGAVKGVGVSTATRIVEKFGDETLKIMEENPDRLAEVKGITIPRARRIGQEFARQFGLREVILAFSPYGLTVSEALRCWRKWGADTVERVRQNPYLLCSGDLFISFERADEICMGMDRPKNDENRIEAGLLYVLRHNVHNGHTCLPAEKLIATACAMLGVTPEETHDALEAMIVGTSVRAETMDDRVFIFLPPLYQAEKYAASRLQLMRGFPVQAVPDGEARIDAMEQAQHIHYADKQRLAMMTAAEKGLLILTGGPGTGKTTTLRGLITLLESMGEQVALAAPTGRAAKRISELTGKEAKTIHRLLEVQWDDSDTPVFDRNEKNPIDAEVLILDEVSMIDVLLFESLLRALKPGTRLILVGDTHQLPAVGPGCVLQDLIDSGLMPVVELTEIFRQAMESQIVSGAHHIVSGAMPDFNRKNGDFFFLTQRSSEDTVQTVLDLCCRRLPQSYGYSVMNQIQVLCPGRKGTVGTENINRCMQERFNPADSHKKEMQVDGQTLREGDKVMHTRNNYDISWEKDSGETGQGVFNGDIGVLEKVHVQDNSLEVRYDDRVAVYGREDAADLELAYAVTVHKSQGSEFEAVILPLYKNVPQLCYRNLLYTAVTRAKTLLIVVGNLPTVETMIRNDRKTMRYSALKHFLMATKDLWE